MIMPFLVLLIAIFLFGLGGMATIWLFLRWRKVARSKAIQEQAPTDGLRFRWSYVILPTAVLVLSIILVAYFYRLLPSEVAYHFKTDGSPDRWFGRGVITVWMLVPQFFLTLLAVSVTAGIAKLGILPQGPAGGTIKPGSVLALMGNMIGLPQLVIGFAMLDIFSYNSYGIHLMPLWVFALIVMGAGGVILGIILVSVARRARRASSSQGVKELDSDGTGNQES